MSAGPIAAAVGLPLAAVTVISLWIHGQRILAARKVEVRRALSTRRGVWVELTLAAHLRPVEQHGRVVRLTLKSVQIDGGNGEMMMIPVKSIIAIDGKPC